MQFHTREINKIVTLQLFNTRLCVCPKLCGQPSSASTVPVPHEQEVQCDTRLELGHHTGTHDCVEEL